MSGIKLPVRAAYSWDRLEFLDAEGQPVAPEDIAAALNAAPTRDFEGLDSADAWAMFIRAHAAAEAAHQDGRSRSDAVAASFKSDLSNLSAPKRAFGELSGALWGIYKAAADAAETVAGDPGGFSTSADWDYYERRLVDELEERLQAFAAPQVPPVAGWIVANSDKTRFRMWGDFGPEWTDDCDKALHFARKQDAEAFCRDDEDAWAILPAALEAPKPTLADVILETADRVGNSPFWHAVRTALERAGRAKLVAAMAANPGAKTLQDMVSPGDAAWVATFAAELSKLDAPAPPEAQGGGE